MCNQHNAPLAFLTPAPDLGRGVSLVMIAISEGWLGQPRKELSMSQGSPLLDENVAAIDNANLYCPCK